MVRNSMIEFTLNGAPTRLDIEDDTPLLWALRENLKLTGTKYGCGIGAVRRVHRAPRRRRRARVSNAGGCACRAKR